MSENASGILAVKFRVFQSSINSNPNYVKKIIFASVALHNFLRENCKTYITIEKLGREDTDQSIIIPDVWEEAPCGFEDIQGISRGHSNDTKKMCEHFKNFFMSSGQVPWQERMALHH